MRVRRVRYYDDDVGLVVVEGVDGYDYGWFVVRLFSIDWCVEVD